MYTFSEVREQYGVWLLLVEEITIAFFCIDYILRVWTADLLYPELKRGHAIRKYMLSFTGIVDILSFLPYYLPISLPMGTVAFRMIRIVRIFRLFRINAYYDSLSVISAVIKGKRQQFIKLHITDDSRWEGKRIADLGLPAGIIVAAIRRKEQIVIPRGDVVFESGDTIVLGAEPFDVHEQINLKEIVLRKHNPWTGTRIRDLDISRHALIVLVKRKNKALIPNGNMILQEGDNVFLYTEKHLSNANEIEI